MIEINTNSLIIKINDQILLCVKLGKFETAVDTLEQVFMLVLPQSNYTPRDGFP